VDNQTLGYFIARIYLFLDKIGIDPQRLRFRQHMANEMAHYAADCWDAEIYNSYGWIECVGCADRSAYDLTVHAVRTKKNLSVQEPLPADQVKTVEKLVAVPDPKVFAKEFKKDNVVVKETLVALEQDRLECIRKELEEKKWVEVFWHGPNLETRFLTRCSPTCSLLRRSSAFTAADGNTYTLTPELVKIEKKSFKETSEFDLCI
jgi:glycyl-tRNA synthetase